MANLTDGQLSRLNKAAEASRNLKLDRIKNYDSNPNKCQNCQVGLLYDKRKNKFCSHSCAAQINNLGNIRNFNDGKYGWKKCFGCKELTDNVKYCGKECFENHKKLIRLKRFLNGDGNFTQGTIKKCLIELHGLKCSVCGITEWNNQVVPLVADHINGNPLDHDPKNLRLVCGNCNMQLPTFAGRNVGKGGGRPYRNKRYLEGKSY
jgi:hypothetical protein